MITPEDIDNRFDYHPPKDDVTKMAHERVRAECRILAMEIVALTPEGREQSLAVTHIEEAMLWANAAIARDPRNR